MFTSTPTKDPELFRNRNRSQSCSLDVFAVRVQKNYWAFFFPVKSYMIRGIKLHSLESFEQAVYSMAATAGST